MTSWYFDNFRMFVQNPEDFEETCDNTTEINVKDATTTTLSDGTDRQVSPNETSATIVWTKGDYKHWD